MRVSRVAVSVIFGFVLSVAAATAHADEVWKDAAMTALLANAETVLEAKHMVSSGRAMFGDITHRVVTEIPGGPNGQQYPVLIEEYVFDVNANYGDVVARMGKLTITQTTIRYPRSSMIEYQAKVESLPLVTILPPSKK
jgi:hypothetical protein